MLRWTIIFIIIAIIAGVLGFGGIAGTSAGIAKIFFFIFIVLFILSLIRGGVRKQRFKVIKKAKLKNFAFFCAIKNLN